MNIIFSQYTIHLSHHYLENRRSFNLELPHKHKLYLLRRNNMPGFSCRGAGHSSETWAKIMLSHFSAK